jgi:hypothetical protein
VPGLRHRAILLQLSPIWSPGGAVRDEIIRFLNDPATVAH